MERPYDSPSHWRRMIHHAAKRGAVRTPNGVGTLTRWPAPNTPRYATVMIEGRFTHPHMRNVEPVQCDECGKPAAIGLVTQTDSLCRDCSEVNAS